ncbi:hypothetical protein Tco_1098858, partial [Tanacetum coccineum]
MSKHKGVYVTPSYTKKVFANVKRPGKEKVKKETKEESGPAEPVTDEATTEAHVSTSSYDPSPSAKTAQAKEIASLKMRVKQLEKRRKSRTLGLRRLRKEDASKQGRKIADLDADAEVTLVDETQGRNDEYLMFDTGVLDGDEVVVEIKEHVVNATTTTSLIPVSVVDPVTPSCEVVTTASAEILDELTLAQTLIKIKSIKPKVVTTDATTVTYVGTRPMAKGVVIQEPSETTTTKTLPIPS